MSAPKGKPGTGWSIEDQVPEIKIGPGNTPTEGVTVHFRTQYGATNNVWLPRLTYNQDSVRAAIQELATTMDTVHTMTG